jgi:hypothetical protein
MCPLIAAGGSALGTKRLRAVQITTALLIAIVIGFFVSAS